MNNAKVATFSETSAKVATFFSENQAILLLDGAKIFFSNTAHGAHPVVGNVLESGTCGDAAVGIAHCGIIDVTADVAYILLHKSVIKLII